MVWEYLFVVENIGFWGDLKGFCFSLDVVYCCILLVGMFVYIEIVVCFLLKDVMVCMEFF